LDCGTVKGYNKSINKFRILWNFVL
jgi:hypothetical protein